MNDIKKMKNKAIELIIYITKIFYITKMGNSVVHDGQLNGHYTHDYNIMLYMIHDMLHETCKTNKLANKVCDTNLFWFDRIKIYLYPDFPYLLLPSNSFRNIYYALIQGRGDVMMNVIYNHASQDDEDEFNNWLDKHEWYLQHNA